jgi:predicted aldo/keto reductase-like oxidoreductase
MMRLPGTIGGGLGPIDEPEAIRMIRCGVDGGVNYVDLGFPWVMELHEPVIRTVGEALHGEYRAKVRTALTIPAQSILSLDDFDAQVEQQLIWLGTDRVDFCLLGRLTRDNWPELQRLGILDRLETAMAEGRIGHAGFSFHDHYQVLRSIVQAYDRWALCSVEYSYMDVGHDPGATGIRYAAEQGLAVVATAPFKGGRLTKEPPEEARRIWAQSPRNWSPAEWALRFVLNHPGISVAVSDMSSTEQLIENLGVAEEARADGLSVSDEVTISDVRDAYRARQPVPCASCRPCMPCPAGIDVPRFFEIYNDAAMYDDLETARLLCAYERINPGDCTGCYECELRCAKRLSIVDWLASGREFLGLSSRR